MIEHVVALKPELDVFALAARPVNVLADGYVGVVDSRSMKRIAMSVAEGANRFSGEAAGIEPEVLAHAGIKFLDRSHLVGNIRASVEVKGGGAEQR